MPAKQRNSLLKVCPLKHEDHLATWLAEEEATRAVMNLCAGPGVTPPAQVVGFSGLEAMQAMLRGELPFIAIAQTLDFMLIEVAERRAVFQGQPGPGLHHGRTLGESGQGH